MSHPRAETVGPTASQHFDGTRLYIIVLSPSSEPSLAVEGAVADRAGAAWSPLGN